MLKHKLPEIKIDIEKWVTFGNFCLLNFDNKTKEDITLWEKVYPKGAPLRSNVQNLNESIVYAVHIKYNYFQFVFRQNLD